MINQRSGVENKFTVAKNNPKPKSLRGDVIPGSGLRAESTRHLQGQPSKKSSTPNSSHIIAVKDHISAVNKYMLSHRNVKNLLHIDEESLPTGTGKKFRLTKNLTPRYALVNILNYFRSRNADVNVKYIYLHRNFYRTVRSHPQFDDGFRNHALMLERYAQLIRSEYATASARDRELWTAVRYEWLHVMNITQFANFVNKLVDFLEWKNCKSIDISKLYGMVRKSKKTQVNDPDFEFANSLDTEVNIPFLLDLSAEDNAEDVKLMSKLNESDAEEVELMSKLNESDALQEN